MGSKFGWTISILTMGMYGSIQDRKYRSFGWMLFAMGVMVMLAVIVWTAVEQTNLAKP